MSAKFKTGVDLPYISKTGAYTATATDYTIDCTANSFTVSLPTAASIAGRVYNIKNTGSGAIIVDPNGSETIDGALTYTLGAQYQCVTVQSNGTNWIIV